MEIKVQVGAGLRAGPEAPAGRMARQPGPGKITGELSPYTQCGQRGGIVWQRNRYGQIHYPWHKPSDPKSPAQRFVRINFGEVSVRWRRLTEPQRLSGRAAAREQKSRRRLGTRYPLRGYYYYMRINVALANRGQPLLDLPPDEPRPADLFPCRY
jgi:hypothetical protein